MCLLACSADGDDEGGRQAAVRSADGSQRVARFSVVGVVAPGVAGQACRRQPVLDPAVSRRTTAA